MALNSRVFIALFHIFIWSFLDTLQISNGTQTDIYCLKSIKGSLEDPYNYLNSSWDFNNKTEGFICQFPKGIENCSSLTGLDLSSNKLSGPLPSDISVKAQSLTLANASYYIRQAYANNKGLCGGPLEPCQTQERRRQFEFSFKSGFLVGYVFTVVLVIPIFMSHYVACMNGKQRGKKMALSKGSSTKKENFEADQLNHLPTKGLLQEESKKISQLEGMVTRMNFTELCEATSNFSKGNAIGLGKIGMMYKAVLPNGSQLAVKRLHGCQSFDKQFIPELLALGSSRDMILEWPLRIKIAIGIARGLAWLHNKCDFRVVHLNLSSKSILLDKNFEPKISNFGGAKVSSSEGVMFMESNDINSSNSSFVDSGIWELVSIGVSVDWVTHLLTSSSYLNNIIDKSLTGQGFDGEIYQLLKIACTCLNTFPGQRPTMLELYNTISILGERYGVTNDSEILRQYEIATANSSNEIVEMRYGVRNNPEILRESEIATASTSNEIVEVESTWTN
uniref:Tyrosine-protein kinase catalytic domain-containing protein n=1 Tax=Fagus sylvatica TaxID=28930 RepID=A0A2N9F719_FAGSY